MQIQNGKVFLLKIPKYKKEKKDETQEIFVSLAQRFDAGVVYRIWNCDGRRCSIPEKPDKLTLLSVANSTGLWDYVSEWENATGIKVEITEMDLPSLQTQATTYFAAQSDEIDLLYSYIALTAEWSSAGYLENIRDYLTEEEWSQILQRSP